jgi:hypothetical protein
MTEKEQIMKEARLLMKAIYKTVAAMGPIPVSETPMLLAFQAEGYSKEVFDAMVDALIQVKAIVRHGYSFVANEAIGRELQLDTP